MGWISAIPVELEAAIEMLDQRHYDLPQASNSSTIYTLGSIGPHNVVMACLSAGRLGIGSAATIATEMRTTFPCIRFGLLVGVGGGVPSTANIRLGDIVVSQPQAGREGVVQYDFGKNTTSGFQRTMLLNAPPDILLNALSNYQARNLDTDGDLVSHRFKPKIAYTGLQKFPAPDMLFRADYNHVSGMTCENCDPAQLSKFPNRDDRCIMVHYGTIASGNQVIKSGTIRDQLSSELGGIHCFEMEAAGIMNTFPSLVIRSICDYADSHKNKAWQRFAALAAAAYGKELLAIIPPLHPSLMSETANTVTSLKKFKFSRSSTQSKAKSGDSQNWWSDYAELVRYEFTIQSISDYHPLRIYREFARSRCPGTTQWILDHETYVQWRAAESSNCLWLTGKIGSGKTLVTSTVIEQLLREEESDDGVVLHYFCRHSHKADLSAIAFLKSCVKQMLTHLESTSRSCPLAIESYLRQYCGPNKDHSDLDEMIENAFIPLTSVIGRVKLVVDGLDECNNKEVQEVLKIVRGFMKEPGRKAFISGRASLDIVNSVPGSLCIHISEEHAVSDISGYIRWKLEEKMLERRIVDDLEVLAEIETTLLENAEQMILWVKLQIENIWEDCSGDADIRAALKNLPKDLTETYNRCLKRISSNKEIYSRGYAAKILPWMLEAVQPLTITQLRQALAIDLDTGIIRHGMIPSVQDTLRSCANLVIQNANEQVVLAHHSVYQYLKNRLEAQRHEAVSTLTEDQETPTLSTTTTLARLCIEHLLSEDYTLAVQQVKQGFTLRLEPSEINRLTAAIPWSIRSFLPQPKPIQVTLPPIQPKSLKIAALPDFFHYAREQWPELTRDWKRTDIRYSKFADLALKPNLTWRLHPWKPLGQSLDSHFFGLLGWSIVNQHESLFKLLFVNTGNVLREDLYAAPFHLYDGLNCVLLAARSNTPWVFDFIPYTVLSTLLKTQDHNGWTALHYAVNLRSTIFVMKLAGLVNDLSVSISSDGVTVLEMAAAKGDSEIVAILLRYPRFSSTEMLLKATVTAIRNGHVSLLDGKLNISQVILNKADDDIKLAVLDAAANGHSDVIKSVSRTLRNSPQLRPKFWRWWTNEIMLAAINFNQSAVFDAAMEQYLDIPDSILETMLRLLIEKIVSSNDSVEYQSWLTMAKNLSGMLNLVQRIDSLPTDLLHFAIKKGRPYQAEMLLERGINPRSPFANGETALRVALSAKQWDIVEILLDKQVDVDARDVSGNTALHTAILDQNQNAVNILLSHGADINNQNRKGETPIHVAAKSCARDPYFGFPSIKIGALLGKSKRAFLEIQDGTGNTALHNAVIADRLDAVEDLIAAGARIYTRNKAGVTVFMFSQSKPEGHPVRELFLKLDLQPKFEDAGILKSWNEQFGETTIDNTVSQGLAYR